MVILLARVRPRDASSVIEHRVSVRRLVLAWRRDHITASLSAPLFGPEAFGPSFFCSWPPRVPPGAGDADLSRSDGEHRAVVHANHPRVGQPDDRPTPLALDDGARGDHERAAVEAAQRARRVHVPSHGGQNLPRAGGYGLATWVDRGVSGAREVEHDSPLGGAEFVSLEADRLSSATRSGPENLLNHQEEKAGFPLFDSRELERANRLVHGGKIHHHFEADPHQLGVLVHLVPEHPVAMNIAPGLLENGAVDARAELDHRRLAHGLENGLIDRFADAGADGPALGGGPVLAEDDRGAVHLKAGFGFLGGGGVRPRDEQRGGEGRGQAPNHLRVPAFFREEAFGRVVFGRLLG